MSSIDHGGFSLDRNNTTIEETFCASLIEFSKSKITRSIFHCFVENITDQSEEKLFLKNGNDVFSILLNGGILLEEHIKFLREDIGTKAIDPKYHQFLFLETVDGTSHPYLVRQGNDIYVNIEKIISEQS